MGNNLNCLSQARNEGEDEMNNEQEMTKARAINMIQNEFRRGTAKKHLRELIQEVIKDKAKTADPFITIEEISTKDFNDKILSNDKIEAALEENKAKLVGFNYEGKEIEYQMKPLKIVDNDKNETQYYYGSWNAKGELCGKGTLIGNMGLYKGTFENNKFNGKGILINPEGNYYIGDFIDGKSEGKGKLVIKDGLTYDGEFKGQLKNGMGVEKTEDETYTGTFKDGKKEGAGKVVFKEGDAYEGGFKDGVFEGEGEYRWKDNRMYRGEFLKGEMNGKGIYKFSDGSVYSGNYVNGIKMGHGLYIWSDEKKFEGNWVNNQPHGTCIYFNGDKKYELYYRFGKLISSRLIIEGEEEKTHEKQRSNVESLKFNDEKRISNSEKNS